MLKAFLRALCCILTILQVSNASRPLVIAHRGASGYLPEHTLEAKVAAMTVGSDFIEQDVVLTKDNVPIVLHDIYLDEVSDVATKFTSRFRMHKGEKRYYAIDFTLEEIKSLQVTERFDHKTKDTQIFENRFPLWQSTFKVPTLEEEIQLIKGYEEAYNRIHTLADESFKPIFFGIYVEIKRPDFHHAENKSEFSQLVLDIVGKYFTNDKESKVIIQCFDPAELGHIRFDLGSKFTLVQLLEADGISNNINYTYWGSMEGLENISTYANGVGPGVDRLVVVNSKSNRVMPSIFYYNVKNLNLLIHPWTFRVDKLPLFVSDYNQMLDLYLNDLKVDGVFTDFPDLTIDYVNRQFNSGNRLIFNFSTSLMALIFYTF